MPIFQLILYVAAAILLGLAAAGVSGRIATGWAGMLCWLVAQVFVPLLG